MDIRVRHNAYGSQIDSFEEDVPVVGLVGQPFPAVFIRAPIIEQIGAGVEVMALLSNGVAVAVRQGHLLASAFHPELSDDRRLHALFLQRCAARHYEHP